jgi:hypothetical protein
VVERFLFASTVATFVILVNTAVITPVPNIELHFPRELVRRLGFSSSRVVPIEAHC